jgi:hypothetical protein
MYLHRISSFIGTLAMGATLAAAVGDPVTSTLSVTASDPDGDPVSYLWQRTGGPTSVTLATPSAASCLATFTAAGVYTFTVTVSDGRGGSTTSSPVTVTVTQNDTPQSASQSVSVSEDIAKPVTLTVTDSTTIGSPGYTYAIGTAPTKGVLSGTGASRTYTPNANATGSDSFTYTVTDGYGRVSSAAIISLSIASTTSSRPGDANGDGVVNSIDMAAVKSRLSTTLAGGGTYNALADVSGDGAINSIDMAQVKQNLTRTYPSP